MLMHCRGKAIRFLTIFLKYRFIYIVCESVTGFTKPGMTMPTTSLLKDVFLHRKTAAIIPV